VSTETYAEASSSSGYPEERAGGGWITFAGVMIVIVATLNIIDGIAAISNSKFYVGDAKYVVSDLNTWGWVILAIGCIQVLAAFGIWAGNRLARWVGIFIVSLNLIAQLMFIPSYPFLALSIFALDVLVLYGLLAHGGRPALS